MRDREINPPAFPTDSEGQIGISTWNFEGMSLRDYFAAKAMAAMITTAAGPVVGGLDGYEPNTAKSAYKIADAMLAERAK
jgi:hypothetical protein